jgi:hypothetical protein
MLASLAILLLLPLHSVTTSAQADVPKFELAGQMALLRTTYFNDIGYGGRFSYNATELFTLETEVDRFPQNRYGEGTKTLSVFGVKFGTRTDSAGFFTKFRPGFISYSNQYTPTLDCSASALIPDSCFAAQRHFAMDFGGGFELFPSRHTIIRFDIGNLLIRANGQTSNNLLMNIGFGYRF